MYGERLENVGCPDGCHVAHTPWVCREDDFVEGMDAHAQLVAVVAVVAGASVDLVSYDGGVFSEG